MKQGFDEREWRREWQGNFVQQVCRLSWSRWFPLNSNQSMNIHGEEEEKSFGLLFFEDEISHKECCWATRHRPYSSQCYHCCCFERIYLLPSSALLIIVFINLFPYFRTWCCVASTPQVWLIKRSNTGSNFDRDSYSHASCYGDEGNSSVHCGTPLPYFESNYDSSTLNSTVTNSNYAGNTFNNGKHESVSLQKPNSILNIQGPDLIHHPMASHSIHETELSLSPSNLYSTTMRGSQDLTRNGLSLPSDEQVSLAQAEGTIVWGNSRTTYDLLVCDLNHFPNM